MVDVRQPDDSTFLGGFHGTAAVLTLLSDPCKEIQVYALRNLVGCVSRQWFEIADYLPLLEELRETESFPERELCALVLSMVYYYLNEPTEAINYALEAGSHFDITSQSEYVQSVLTHCLDTYCKVSSHNYVQRELVKSKRPRSLYPDVDDDDLTRPMLSSHYPSTGDDVVDLTDEGDDVVDDTDDGNAGDSGDDMLESQGSDDEDDRIRDLVESSAVIDACRESSDQFGRSRSELMQTDPRLEQIVNRLMYKCLRDGRYKQAVGICIEARRLDWLRHAVQQSGRSIIKAEDSLNYVMTCCEASEFINGADSKAWQRDVLSLCVQVFVEHLPAILKLESGKRPDYFRMMRCYTELGEAGQLAELLVNLVDSSDGLHLALQLAIDLFYSSNQHFRSQVLSSIHRERSRLVARYRAAREADENKENPQREDEEAMLDEEYEEFDDEEAPNVDEELLKNEDIVNLDRLHNALNGSQSMYLTMQFLIRNNRADLHLLKFIKDHSRNMLCHGAVVTANGFMHCGTTCDQFLRDNLDWLGNAQNWARFTATASLGVIHRFHEKEALRLMDAYLPKEGGASSPYAEGGGLYALGLIFAGHGSGEIIQYIEDAVSSGDSSPVLKHGACLGLGLLTLGTRNRKVLSLLKKEMLSIGDAVVGEAACIAIGMVMMGSRSRGSLSEMIAQCEQVEHEKIARGASVSIALICFDQRDKCKKTIITLQRSQCVFVRRAGMYAIAMAWLGTGYSQAVRTLLHFAVSDVSDDVRRAAVEALGFVMYRQPADKIIATISLLIESYNPHVRYGAAMALGIAFSGTANAEAVKLIEPLTQDSVTFVRLGSFIGQTMIVGDAAEATCPQTKTIRVMLSRVIQDKHEDLMAKWGAIIAQGIIDACGRNASICLSSPSQPDLNCPLGAAGCLLFLHFWFWFPAAHMLSLAFRPSALILVDENLQPPEIELQSTLAPNHFAYPATLLDAQRRGDKTGAAGEKLEAAVLSIRKQRGIGVAGTKAGNGGTKTKASNTGSARAASHQTGGSDKKDEQAGQTATKSKRGAKNSKLTEFLKDESRKGVEEESAAPSEAIPSPKRKISSPTHSPRTPASPVMERSPQAAEVPLRSSPRIAAKLAGSADQLARNAAAPAKASSPSQPQEGSREEEEEQGEESSRSAKKAKQSTDRAEGAKEVVSEGGQGAEDNPLAAETVAKQQTGKATSSVVISSSLRKDNLPLTPESPPLAERKRAVKGAASASASAHGGGRLHRSTKLRNLAVIRNGYESSIVYPSSGRFQPAYVHMKCGTAQTQPPRRGIVVMVDTKPDSGTYRLMRMMKSVSLPKEDTQKEPEPPEPFEFAEASAAKAASSSDKQKT